MWTFHIIYVVFNSNLKYFIFSRYNINETRTVSELMNLFCHQNFKYQSSYLILNSLTSWYLKHQNTKWKQKGIINVSKFKI